MNTGSVEGGTGWYLVVLVQIRAVLVASMLSFQKIYCLHGLNYQIIEYSKKEKVITDRHTHRQTDRISSCRLDPFCRRGRVKRTTQASVLKIGQVLESKNYLRDKKGRSSKRASVLFRIVLQRHRRIFSFLWLINFA